MATKVTRPRLLLLILVGLCKWRGICNKTSKLAKTTNYGYYNTIIPEIWQTWWRHLKIDPIIVCGSHLVRLIEYIFFLRLAFINNHSYKTGTGEHRDLRFVQKYLFLRAIEMNYTSLIGSIWDFWVQPLGIAHFSHSVYIPRTNFVT